MISDLKDLKQACDSRKMKDSELEFAVIDPPKSVIVSSDDDKLTVKGVTDFLTKKKLETLKVKTTEEGSISVKFMSPEGMSFIIAFLFYFFKIFFILIILSCLLMTSEVQDIHEADINLIHTSLHFYIKQQHLVKFFLKYFVLQFFSLNV